MTPRLKGTCEFCLPRWQRSSTVLAPCSQELKEVAFKTLILGRRQVLPPPVTCFCLINAHIKTKFHNNQVKVLVCCVALPSAVLLSTSRRAICGIKARDTSSLPLSGSRYIHETYFPGMEAQDMAHRCYNSLASLLDKLESKNQTCCKKKKADDK